jgi:hypothetical protein
MYFCAQLLISQSFGQKTHPFTLTFSFFGIPFANNLVFAYMASILGGRPKNFPEEDVSARFQNQPEPQKNGFVEHK